MPHDRFYLKGTLEEGDEAILQGEEAHHLSHVMRKGLGDRVELVNGADQLAVGKIVKLERKSVHLVIESVERKEPPPFLIIVCQAIARSNRLDTIVEKGTELGMGELWLFPGQLSEKKEISMTQYHRLEAIAIAAMKQSGRLDLPKIHLKPPLVKWKGPLLADGKEPSLFFGDLSKDAPPLLTCYRRKNHVLFFNGPESGFSIQEKQQLAAMQVQGVSLHPNVLRTDTAPLVLLSLISAIQ
jgi:16S rRNA (uracil1498-N3)-methyltransferase